MLQAIYIFLGVMAAGTSVLSISDRLPIDVKVASATASFLLWTLWGLSSYNVEVVTNTGTIIQNSYTALVLVGLALAGVMLAFAIWNIMGMFGMDPQRLLKVRI